MATRHIWSQYCCVTSMQEGGRRAKKHPRRQNLYVVGSGTTNAPFQFTQALRLSEALGRLRSGAVSLFVSLSCQYRLSNSQHHRKGCTYIVYSAADPMLGALHSSTKTRSKGTQASLTVGVRAHMHAPVSRDDGPACHQTMPGIRRDWILMRE